MPRHNTEEWARAVIKLDAALKDKNRGSSKEIAQQLDFTRRFVSQRAKKIGVPFKRTGRSSGEWTEADKYFGILNDKDIGRLLAVPPDRVRLRRVALGIEAMPRLCYKDPEYIETRKKYLGEKLESYPNAEVMHMYAENIWYQENLEKWDRSPELREFVEELKCQRLAGLFSAG